MLSKMEEEGANYAEVLAEAQALGYAEADPTADVEGHDAQAKERKNRMHSFEGRFYYN